MNVGAVDADVVQLAIGISRKLLQDIPIDAAGAQEGVRENIFMAVSFWLTALLIFGLYHEP